MMSHKTFFENPSSFSHTYFPIYERMTCPCHTTAEAPSILYLRRHLWMIPHTKQDTAVYALPGHLKYIDRSSQLNYLNNHDFQIDFLTMQSQIIHSKMHLSNDLEYETSEKTVLVDFGAQQPSY